MQRKPTVSDSEPNMRYQICDYVYSAGKKENSVPCNLVFDAHAVISNAINVRQVLRAHKQAQLQFDEQY